MLEWPIARKSSFRTGMQRQRRDIQGEVEITNRMQEV